MGYPNGGTKGPKPGKLFVCVLLFYLFPPLSDFSISFESCVVSASKDMVLKLDPQMDKGPSLMVNSMTLLLL